MYSAIAISTRISPRTAFFEISDPHVGPMSSTLMSVLEIPACVARSLRILVESGSPVRLPVRIATESPLTTWTDPVSPYFARVASMSWTVAPVCSG